MNCLLLNIIICLIYSINSKQFLKSEEKPKSIILQLSDINLEAIRKDILKNHNYHRKRHQVQNLARNSEIEKIAQEYSKEQAKNDQMEHSSNTYKNKPLGENLYSCWSSSSASVNGTRASESWYSEVKSYDFNNPGYKKGIGHFTQLVWKDSKEIGCGAACSSTNNCYVTCNYYPAGNYLDSFPDNVFPFNEDFDDDDDNDDDDDGMSTAGKVFLAIFIIFLTIFIAFLIHHFFIQKKTFNDLLRCITFKGN